MLKLEHKDLLKINFFIKINKPIVKTIGFFIPQKVNDNSIIQKISIEIVLCVLHFVFGRKN